MFADDPLFRGYWASCDGAIDAWKGNFDEILRHAPDGFVAVAPGETGLSQTAPLVACLEDLREILKRGELRRLTLLFRDGLKIEIGRHDVLRFWRKVSPLLTAVNGDD